MIRMLFLHILLLSKVAIHAQNLNDNCENATDITPEVFNAEDWSSCNSIIGTTHQGFGLVTDEVDHPTVDPPGYNSQGCIGYASETTDHYPDIWYKSTLNESGVVYFQRLFLNMWDTVQLAIYYGQCGSLYQSQCFTLTYTDSVMWQGAWIEYYPHEPDDEIYFQLKFPPHYQGYAEMCFSDLYFGAIYYNFSYDRPADTGNTTQVQSGSIEAPIFMYPNPTNTELYIHSENSVSSVTVTDLHGKVWLEQHSLSINKSITTEHLPSGMYILTVYTDKGIGVSKFCRI